MGLKIPSAQTRLLQEFCDRSNRFQSTMQALELHHDKVYHSLYTMLIVEWRSRGLGRFLANGLMEPLLARRELRK